MDKKFSSIAIDAAVAAVGIVFLVFHAVPDFVTWIARIIGMAFAVAAATSLAGTLAAMRKRNEPAGIAGMASAVGSLCFGVVLMLRGHLFVDSIGIITAIAIVAMGLYQVVTPVVMRKTMHLHWWLFALPLAVMGAGVAMLACDISTELMSLISGLCFVCFTADDLLQRRACDIPRPTAVADGEANGNA